MVLNYKHEGMLVHSFDRFYITKFILPSIGDLNSSALHYDTCMHLDINNICNVDTKRYLLDLRTFCKKIEPFVLLLRN